MSSIKLEDLFGNSNNLIMTIVKLRHPQKTVVFQECVPNLSNYRTSYSYWMPLKFSEGDTVSLAYTLRLPYIADSKLDSFVSSPLVGARYEYDQSRDFSYDVPNTKMVYLGQVTITKDTGTFYKFLDINQSKLKWLPEKDLKEMIRKAQYKDIQNLDKKIRGEVSGTF